ncbi:acyltransferase family protein [uncultured Sulfuricurvum sp.]|uniref:acyltransferase n=1 Tax=uncultured Sulfuricurvum sp. TaxID=430693 RepID=UPI0026301611|nr:acyltransferase family protein [uncultured Sulfuricurvum sp.]
MDTKNHLVWGDICRLIAIFGVILIHCATPILQNYHTLSLDKLLVANVIDSYARVSVPLFVMLSGTLLLGQKYHNHIFDFFEIKKRIFKIAVPLLFWSCVYLIFTQQSSKAPLDILYSFGSILNTPAMYHLWFAYMILGVYLLLPILRLIAKAVSRDTYFALYFFALWIIINSLTVYSPINLISQLKLAGFLGWGGYFILGFYLSNANWTHHLSNKISFMIFFMAGLCTFLLTWYLNLRSTSFIEIAFEPLSPNCIIASIGAFLLLQKVQVNKHFIKPLAFISKRVFPIYFIHILIISILGSDKLGFVITPLTIHPAIGILILAFTTFLISLFIILILQKVPFISKLVG